MPDLMQCQTHGECERTYVCNHLIGGAAGLGFNGAEPSAEKPFPDAWCDDCNVIFEAHDGWSEQTEGLVNISLLCSECYKKARIRNTRTDVTLTDLEGLRWKCYSCEEWHTGPCLDFGFTAPVYWTDSGDQAEDSEEQANQQWPLDNDQLGPLELDQGGSLDADRLPKTFLDDDLCIINGEHFFVRGLLQLPIIGTAETFRWGVWGSVSKDSFVKLVRHYDDPKRIELEPMFSWLSNQFGEYEDTLALKMYAHIQTPGERPNFELEDTEHQLSREYHHGITPERVKEIMKRKLKETE